MGGQPQRVLRLLRADNLLCLRRRAYVFDARLENRLGAGFQGEYWSIEGDNNTFVTVKNITPKAATCGIALHYNQGGSTYEMPPLTLQPGEARVINLKRLQKEKIADAKGAVLPATVTFGGLKLTEEAGGRHFLMEATVFNPRTGTCGVCGFGCLYPLSLVTVPGGIDLLIAQQSGDITVNANMCDGTVQTGWGCQCNFSSKDTTVATVEALCIQHATGVGVGSTSLLGTATGIPGPRCGEQTLLTSCSVSVRPKVQITGGNNFVFSGSDSTLIQFNAQQAQGSPSGGVYSWSASNNRVSFDNSSAAIVHLTGISPSTGLLDTTLTVNYSLNQQSASPASRSITVRIFKFLQQSGQIQVIQLNGPNVFGYDANVFYNVFTNPGGQIVSPGYSGIPVFESVTITSGNFPVSLTQASGATDQNSQIVDQLSLRSNMPLDPSLQVKANQDLGVGGFFVRNNTLLYQASGPSITNNGPFN